MVKWQSQRGHILISRVCSKKSKFNSSSVSRPSCTLETGQGENGEEDTHEQLWTTLGSGRRGSPDLVTPALAALNFRSPVKHVRLYALRLWVHLSR